MAGKNKIYTVEALRWGSRENHSFIVGVYTKKQAAINAAIDYEDSRGGKYGCSVEEWTPNTIESTVILGAMQGMPVPQRTDNGN